jgi:hypothetical protein
MDKKLVEQAKRPMDKRLGKSGQAPNGQEVGEIRPSAQWTRSWGNQAKRPMDKKSKGCSSRSQSASNVEVVENDGVS